jgi:hypothetical protein
VIGGKPGARKQIPLPFSVRTDTIYRVRVEVKGSNFTTLIQGTVVDSWSDDRLKSGGVGFFSDKGEQASVRWVEVTHQLDMLGRLCAYLAPPRIAMQNGSWNR